MIIKVNNLVYSYKRGKNVLDNISMEIKDSKILVILGLNGCGKTTLIKNMSGIYKPLYGSITIDGRDIHNMAPKERSKYITYLSQKVNSFDDFIVRDYLSFSFLPELTFYQKPSKEQLSLIDKYASSMNISYLLDKKIDEISGGQRQLVQICGALLQNTEIIILDEPFSALDMVNQNIVLKALDKIVKESNKTIILSTHNPNHALFLKSDVALMKEGKVVAFGKSSDIVNPEKLKAVYGDSICFSNELDYEEVSLRI